MDEATQEAGRSRRLPLEPVYNERGVIAETYYDLQGLGVLDAVRSRSTLPRTSGASLLRAVFQAVEIALLNLEDVVGRAVADLEAGALGPVTVKMLWARGFHRVLTHLSLLPGRLSGIGGDGPARGELRLADSPAFRRYRETLRRFDERMLEALDDGTLDLDRAVADLSLDSMEFNLVQAVRICGHETTVWEANLLAVAVPWEVTSFEDFVDPGGMRDAVYERVLTGDTYFTQFRGLHQIPETLGEEANDYLEEAIRRVRDGRLQGALEHLRCVNVLAEAMLTSLAPMADNLSTSDYHQIRENLGLTSGSHSICLRFHLFTDLYEQLAHAVIQRLTGRPAAESGTEEVRAALAAVDAGRHEDPSAWMLHQVVNDCLRLRTAIFQWRNEHLHMPRNNLGGGKTKSLTGSPDAITAVKQMRRAARAKDPMIPLAHARGLLDGDPDTSGGPLTTYFDTAESLDRTILARTGSVTQERFQQVQQRLGFFANRCPFSVPPRREA